MDIDGRFFFLLISVPGIATSDGIPFSGNHTYDQIQALTGDIPGDSNFQEDYLHGINQTPSGINHALYLGKSSLKAGNASEAQRQFSYILSRDQNDREAWTGLFVSLNLQEKYDDLLNQTNKAINLSPFDDQFWLEKGWALGKGNKDGESLEAFRQVQRLNPKNVYGYYYSAWAYAGLNQNQNAIKAYEKVSQLSPEYGGVSGNIAFLYVGHSQYRDAAPYLDKALQWYPNWTEARRTKGMVLYNLDQKDEAIKTWDEALRIDPTYINTYWTKAEALIDLGKYADAVNVTDSGLIIKQNDTNLLVLKGDALIRLSRFDDARQVFENVTAIYLTKPEDEGRYNRVYALWRTGTCLDSLGKKDEANPFYRQALTQIEAALKKYPDAGLYWHLKAEILDSLGEYRDAQVAGTRAEELKFPVYFYL